MTVSRAGSDRSSSRQALSTRDLRAGPVSVTLVEGGLRWLHLDGVEVVRGIHVAVRDDRWRTIGGVIEELDVVSRPSSFEVTFGSRHIDGVIDFRWSGRLVGDRDGTIEMSMDGAASSGFAANRIGICVLHPMALAGTPLEIDTPAGRIHGSFPVRISAEDPFTDITAMRFPVAPSSRAVLAFTGDLFEMEDQRNWTDASFKTFSTPHRFPIPVAIEPGSRITQSVMFRIERGPKVPRPSMSKASAPHHDVVEVAAEPGPSLPSIGTSLAPGHGSLDTEAVGWLRAMHPDGLRVVLGLDQPGWEARLVEAADTAGQVGARLDVEAVVGDAGDAIGDLVDVLARCGGRRPDVYVFPAGGLVTTASLASRLREAAASADVALRVGGGSRANFAELNRADLPLHLLDIVGYPISPQVHAFDDASLFETIGAQAVTVRDARHLIGSCALSVGPITLLPRFNPYTGTPPPSDLDPEATRADPRQDTWLAAAWTLASLESVTAAGATAVALHEAVGPAGILGRDPARTRVSGGGWASVNPTYAVLREVGTARVTSTYRSRHASDIAVLAMGIQSDGGGRILVANLTSRPRTITVQLPEPTDVRVRRLGAGDPRDARGEDGAAPVGLAPYEVVRFETP